MVRDVAYESLPKRERQRAAPAGRGWAVERPRRQPAARPARRLPPGASGGRLPRPRRSDARRAGGRRAGAPRRHRARGTRHAGGRGYQRALELAGPERGWGLREARILASLGEIRYWLGEFERAVPVSNAPSSSATATSRSGPRLPGSSGTSARSSVTPSVQPSCSTRRSWRLAVSAIRGRSRARCSSQGGRRPLRQDSAVARAMFDEALRTARVRTPSVAGRRLARWSRSRCSRARRERGGLAASGGRGARDRRDGERSVLDRSGRKAVGRTLRHMMRLDEAESHLDGAVDAFRASSGRGGSSPARSRLGVSRDGSPGGRRTP